MRRDKMAGSNDQGRRLSKVIASKIDPQAGLILLAMETADGRQFELPFLAPAAGAAAMALLGGVVKLGYEGGVQSVEPRALSVVLSPQGETALVIQLSGGAEIFVALPPGGAANLAQELTVVGAAERQTIASPHPRQ